MELDRAKELPKQVKTFNKGEHFALGITQILLGILTVLLGIVLDVGNYNRFFFAYVTGKAAYWSGVLYIASGSMSVAAAKNPKLPLVKGMLGMNVIGTLTAIIAIVFSGITLEESTRNGYHWSPSFDSIPTEQIFLYEHVMIPHNISCGIMIILTAFSGLEILITLANAVFGCMAVCDETVTEMIVVVYQNPPPDNADGKDADGNPPPVGPPADGKDVLNP